MPGPSRQQTVSIRATRLWSSTWPITIRFSGRSRQHLRPRPQVSGPLMMIRRSAPEDPPPPPAAPEGLPPGGPPASSDAAHEDPHLLP